MTLPQLTAKFPDEEMRPDFELNVGRSNEIMPDNEKTIVRNLLLNAQNGLDELDAEISRVKSLLTTLQQQREDSVSRIVQFKIALSNEKLLPPEILAKIFVLSLPSDSVNLRHRPDETPWTYLYVSSRWRRVALDEHRLWSALVVDTSIGVTKSWLQSLWSPNPGSEFLVSLRLEQQYPTTTIHHLLSDYAPRLKSLSIMGTKDEILVLTHTVTLNFKHLESVTLEWTHQSGTPGPPGPLFNSTPSLANVEMIGPHERLSERILDLPWSQLSSLQLTNVFHPLTTFYSILSQSPNLVHFKASVGGFEVDTDYIPHMKSLPNIVLPVLRKLSLVLDFYCQVDGHFQRLMAPSLQNLDIAHLRFPEPAPTVHPFPHAEFIAMLERSPHLKAFVLGYKVSDAELMAILKKTPELKQLLLCRVNPLSGDAFDMMRHGELLPQLKHLVCITDSPNSALDLLEYQCSRNDPQEHPGLSTAYIGYPRLYNTAGVWERFWKMEPQFRASGRQIVVEERRLEPSYSRRIPDI